MIDVRITETPIQIDEVSQLLCDPACGAQLIFTGTVRNLNQGKKVRAVSYDAFVPLTEKVLREICQEARDKWAVSVVLWHRLGRVEVGEISVAIGVSSVHRDEAYQASRQVIEELKHRAPIWKQEHYEQGESQWLQGHALCGHSSAV